MTVTITSEVLGKQPGETYTGPLESWLLAQGYAKQTGYTGPGVQNTGSADDVPAKDPRLPENRDDKAYFPLSEDRNVTIANDATNLNKTKFPAPTNFDFDAGGVDLEVVNVVDIAPNSGPATGGTVVDILADNVGGVTGVTFGGVAGTALDVDTELGVIHVTTPSHAAGAVNVVVTDNTGSDTVTNGFTYTA